MFVLLLMSNVMAQEDDAVAGMRCPMQKHAVVEEGLHFLRGDAVNLRSGASTQSDVVTELRLGTRVRTGDCEKKETISEVEGCWHPVSVEAEDLALNELSSPTSGYLFSTALIDCAVEIDWDDDGVKERVFHAVRGSGELQIRILDPNNAPHVFWGVAAAGVDEYSGEFSALPKSASRQTLLVVDHHGGEFCGSGSITDYFSFDVELGVQNALHTFAFSDAPAYHQKTASFLPDGRAIVREDSGEEVYWEDENGESFYEDFSESSEEMLCFEKGVYTPCVEPGAPVEFTEKSPVSVFGAISGSDVVAPLACHDGARAFKGGRACKRINQSVSMLYQPQLERLAEVAGAGVGSCGEKSYKGYTVSPSPDSGFYTWPKAAAALELEWAPVADKAPYETFIYKQLGVDTLDGLKLSTLVLSEDQQTRAGLSVLQASFTSPSSEERVQRLYLSKGGNIETFSAVGTEGESYIDAFIPREKGPLLMVRTETDEREITRVFSSSKKGLVLLGSHGCAK